MAPVPGLMAKYQVLSRCVASLPSELDIWIKWTATGSTLERNFSQIRALDYFTRTLCKLNDNSISDLDPAGNVDVFLSDALDLTQNLIKSHAVWDFFRERLELRFVPQFRHLLLVADLISYDCYNTVMDRAKALQIGPAQGYREYPLIGLVTEFSPATWPRGQRPPALENRCLPVPIIDLPWDHLTNPWGLLIIAHEVGHDVAEDLGKIAKLLQSAVTQRLDAGGTSSERIVRWKKWTSEIIADLVGVLLTGPAFVGALAGLLTLPRYQVRLFDMRKHPPHYLRIFINTTLVRRLGLSHAADALDAGWKVLYGEPGTDFEPYLADIEPVVSAILDTPLDTLQNQQDGRRHSLSELLTFTLNDQALIDRSAARLADGVLPDGLPIRHVVSASQMAFEQVVRGGNTARLEGLAQCTRQAVIALSPPGQLAAGVGSRRAEQHLEGLARALLERPLEDFGLH
jgi:hypothetical protein